MWCDASPLVQVSTFRRRVMAGVLEERAAIEQEIAGRTVCEQLKEAAERNPDAPAYSDPIEGGWSTLTYAEARRRVLEIAAGLRRPRAGARRRGRADDGQPQRARAGRPRRGARGRRSPCSVYATFAPEQVAFVAADCRGADRGAGRPGRAGPLAAGARRPARRSARSSCWTGAPARRRPVPQLGRLPGAGPRSGWPPTPPRSTPAGRR